jgi:hypothetical protein
MTYKNIILAALLLPCMAYPITEEERIEQLEEQARETRIQITQLNESLGYEALLVFLGKEKESLAAPIVKEIRKLQKQLKKINQQLEKMGVTYE